MDMKEVEEMEDQIKRGGYAPRLETADMLRALREEVQRLRSEDSINGEALAAQRAEIYRLRSRNETLKRALHHIAHDLQKGDYYEVVVSALNDAVRTARAALQGESNG